MMLVGDSEWTNFAHAMTTLHGAHIDTLFPSRVAVGSSEALRSDLCLYGWVQSEQWWSLAVRIISFCPRDKKASLNC